MQPREGSELNSFTEAPRNYQTFLVTVELRCLVWIAERLPKWTTPDHLTLLGFISSIGMGLAYAVVPLDARVLFTIPFLLAANWFGDGLNGTLARVRDCVRPRYGFYVDHIVDTIGAVLLIGGLSLSGLMTPAIAAGLLISFLILSVEVYVATYAVGTFQMSHWQLGPTEVRMVLASVSILAYWFPTVTVGRHTFLVFDLLGELGIVCGTGMFLAGILRNLRILQRIDPS